MFQPPDKMVQSRSRGNTKRVLSQIIYKQKEEVGIHGENIRCYFS